ncbi:MAG TPA: IS110 family transposase [Thermodesulfobacteriota bacterium]|nr:IS110 family transposase [Thermodesulfobacteriota bacterium]
MTELFVGIDVAKDTSSAQGIDSNGKGVFFLTFGMDSEGFMQLWKAITTHRKDLSEVLVAVESTACYHINLYSFLTAKGAPTVVINPLLIANFAKLSLRKTKTDKKDAMSIAQFLLVNRETISQLSLSQDLQDFRDIARERESVCNLLSAHKVEVKRLLQSTFPELERIGDVSTRVMQEFIAEFPSARLVKMARPKVIQEILQRKGVGTRLTYTAELLIQAAKTSVATTSPAKELILQGKVRTLQHLRERYEELTKILTEYCKASMLEDFKIMTSIDGISKCTATTFLAEIGCISNYASYKKLIAFAGIDPTVYQSGKFEGASRISKRGNRHLRRVIWLMTTCVIEHNAIFRAYYMKKRGEGQPFKKAVFATAHKLIRLIFAMLTQRTMFTEVCA